MRPAKIPAAGPRLQVSWGRMRSWGGPPGSRRLPSRSNHSLARLRVGPSTKKGLPLAGRGCPRGRPWRSQVDGLVVPSIQPPPGVVSSSQAAGLLCTRTGAGRPRYMLTSGLNDRQRFELMLPMLLACRFGVVCIAYTQHAACGPWRGNRAGGGARRASRTGVVWLRCTAPRTGVVRPRCTRRAELRGKAAALSCFGRPKICSAPRSQRTFPR